MRKIGNKGLSILLTLCFALVNLSSLTAAPVGPDDFSRLRSALDEENNLNIGIPDFPRRIRKDLPEITKDLGIKAGILKFHPSYATEGTFSETEKGVIARIVVTRRQDDEQ